VHACENGGMHTSTLTLCVSLGVVTCILLLWDCARRIARRPRRLGTGAVAMEALGCILRCAIVCMPTALFQAWAFLRFCVHVGDNTRPWCHRRPLPLIYTFVQEHYWCACTVQ
jgi:hypothetical protein